MKDSLESRFLPRKLHYWLRCGKNIFLFVQKNPKREKCREVVKRQTLRTIKDLSAKRANNHGSTQQGKGNRAIIVPSDDKMTLLKSYFPLNPLAIYIFAQVWQPFWCLTEAETPAKLLPNSFINDADRLGK